MLDQEIQLCLSTISSAPANEQVQRAKNFKNFITTKRNACELSQDSFASKCGGICLNLPTNLSCAHLPLGSSRTFAPITLRVALLRVLSSPALAHRSAPPPSALSSPVQPSNSLALQRKAVGGMSARLLLTAVCLSTSTDERRPSFGLLLLKMRFC